MKQAIIEFIIDFVVFCFKIALIIATIIGAKFVIYYAIDFIGEKRYEIKYEALQKAKQEYEAVFMELVELHQIYEDTFQRVEEISKKYKLRNSNIKQAIIKANDLIKQYETIYKNAQEALDFSQGQREADKETIQDYTKQISEILQAQQKAIKALQEYIEILTLEALKNNQK